MTAESIRIGRDALLTRIVASTASATRALKTMIRNLRRSQWFLLVAVVGGAVLAVVAIKLTDKRPEYWAYTTRRRGCPG